MLLLHNLSVPFNQPVRGVSPFQSACKRFHSTDTPLLDVHNDVLWTMDERRRTELTLLDLSAAFGTTKNLPPTDHSILLDRVGKWLGVTGRALRWFSSYLSDRSQQVQQGSFLPRLLHCLLGVPQGSVLGPAGPVRPVCTLYYPS